MIHGTFKQVGVSYEEEEGHKNNNLVRHGEPEKKPSRKCISRKPHSGHIVGNDVFYD
jgi:hypothetical protein